MARYGRKLGKWPSALWLGLRGGGRWAAVLLLLAALAWRQGDPGGMLEIGRAKVFDLYQRAHPRPRPAERPVAVVDIDEASLAALGQWPWSRLTLARMVDNLFRAGAAVVAFDVVFAEPDRLSPAQVAHTLDGLDAPTRARLAAMPGNDDVLAATFARHGRVVLGQTVTRESAGGGGGRSSIATLHGDPAAFLDHYPALVRNLEVLDRAAAGRGIFNVAPEPDGVVRRIPAAVAVGDTIHPALAVEMLRVGRGEASTLIRMARPEERLRGIKDVVVRPDIIQTDPHGRMFLYAAPYDRAAYVSAYQVVDGSFDPARVAGRLVLVGTSAAGLLDIRSTALDRQIPGVDVHAQLIETVLAGMQLSVPLDADFIECAATILVALLMIGLVPAIGARWTLPVFLVLAGAMAGWSWWQFAAHRQLYDPVFPAVTALVLFVQLTYWAYAGEEAKRRQVRAAFGRYLSPALVERLAQDPSRLRLGGEMRDMTLLFCDVRGFTTISEQFDAQGLTRLINRFLTPMTNVILECGGTIDKYMGDCIMAFWNAPLDDDDHARHACRAALAMMARLEPLNRELEDEATCENRRHVPIKIGIGLNSGPVCVGNMGSDQRFDYSVLGDTVNLASRLEGQSKPYGVFIVIGDETRRRAPDYAALELDLIKVKGKTEAVRIWALLGDPVLAGQEWFARLQAAHQSMLDAYRAQDWDRAAHWLDQCGALRNGLAIEGFYALMAARIDAFRAAPPGPGWDGVFTATTK